jgi:hypothetical protein
LLIYNDFRSRSALYKVLLWNTGVKVKVFRRNNMLGNSYKVLLPALSRTCLENFHNRIFHNSFICSIHSCLARLNYNELKIRILSLFESTGELDSRRIRELLAKAKAVQLTDKAVEMALMRYWRQGLLSRTRRSGMFQYSLTERGLARKEWLLRNQ